LNVPVIVPPSCFSVIVCVVFREPSETSTFQFPATLAGASAATAATANASNITIETKRSTTCEEIARMEDLTLFEVFDYSQRKDGTFRHPTMPPTHAPQKIVQRARVYSGNFFRAIILR
jgi:hypothetical protein